MKMIANIAIGAVLATTSLGPSAWADMVRVNGGILETVVRLAAPSQTAKLVAATAQLRAAIPQLRSGAQ
jgi:hypothetical protein